MATNMAKTIHEIPNILRFWQVLVPPLCTFSPESFKITELDPWPNLYACLILRIELWATESDIVLFLSSLMLRKSG